MQLYANIDDLWTDTIRQLLDRGEPLDSRVGNCVEMLGYSASLANIEQTFLMNSRRKLSPYYGCAEFLWYLSAECNIERIKAYAPQYANFAEDDAAYGQYGYRWLANLQRRDLGDPVYSQLEYTIDLLQQDPNTRQAIVTMWEANDLRHAILRDHKDLPCTLSLQFLLRREKLHLVTTMRSNDVWLGLPYDVFVFTCLQRLVASCLGVLPGSYTHQVGSMHLYDKNAAAAREAAVTKLDPAHRRMEHGWDNSKPRTELQVLRADTCLVEEYYRMGDNVAGNAMFAELECDISLNSVLHDAIAVCARKWGVNMQIRSPILKEML